MQYNRAFHSQQHGDPIRQNVVTWAAEDSDMEVDGAFVPGPTGGNGKQSCRVMGKGWMLYMWVGRKGTVMVSGQNGKWAGPLRDSGDPSKGLSSWSMSIHSILSWMSYIHPDPGLAAGDHEACPSSQWEPGFSSSVSGTPRLGPGWSLMCGAPV